MKVDFIELTNFRGIQKQRITFENKNFVAFETEICYNRGVQSRMPVFRSRRLFGGVIMITATVTDVQNNFGHYLQAVQQGNEIIILKNSK